MAPLNSRTLDTKHWSAPRSNRHIVISESHEGVWNTLSSSSSLRSSSCQRHGTLWRSQMSYYFPQLFKSIPVHIRDHSYLSILCPHLCSLLSIHFLSTFVIIIIYPFCVHNRVHYYLSILCPQMWSLLFVRLTSLVHKCGHLWFIHQSSVPDPNSVWRGFYGNPTYIYICNCPSTLSIKAITRVTDITLARPYK